MILFAKSDDDKNWSHPSDIVSVTVDQQNRKSGENLTYKIGEG